MRHGHTEPNRLEIVQSITVDEPLNERGRQEAGALGEYIGRYLHRSPRVIYTSPSKRARETAQRIAEQLFIFDNRNSRNIRQNIFEETAFREVDHGSLDGMSYASVKARFPDAWERWHTSPLTMKFPEGDDVFEKQNIAVQAFFEVLERHPQEDIMIVSHGGTINLILGAILKTADIWSIGSNHTGLAIIERKKEHGRDHRLTIVTLNSTAHLVEGIPLSKSQEAP